MNLTVSLEMAKKLKKAGWSKECEFVFAKPFDENNYYTGDEPAVEHRQWIIYNEMEKAIVCEAPTITELLEGMDNNTLVTYAEIHLIDLPEFSFIDLFRSPDNLAEVWLWAKREGLIK